jgi:hypothetical protein
LYIIKMKNVLGVGKAVRKIAKAAKSAAESAASAVFASAKKGAKRSAKSASPMEVNRNAVKAANMAARRVRNA